MEEIEIKLKYKPLNLGAYRLSKLLNLACYLLLKLESKSSFYYSNIIDFKNCCVCTL